jgi:ubiquitin C-terminal hydrolase
MDLDVIVVAYLSNINHVDFLQIKNEDIFEIGGILNTSFMRNETPTQLQHITGEQFRNTDSTTTHNVLTYVNCCMFPKTHDIVSMDEATTTQFFEFSVKLLQETFAFNSPLNCFVHSHVVLCYLKNAINVDGLFGKENTVKWVFENYLNTFISNNSVHTECHDEMPLDVEQSNLSIVDESGEGNGLPCNEVVTVTLDKEKTTGTLEKKIESDPLDETDVAKDKVLELDQGLITNDDEESLIPNANVVEKETNESSLLSKHEIDQRSIEGEQQSIAIVDEAGKGNGLICDAVDTVTLDKANETVTLEKLIESDPLVETDGAKDKVLKPVTLDKAKETVTLKKTNESDPLDEASQDKDSESPDIFNQPSNGTESESSSSSDEDSDDVSQTEEEEKTVEEAQEGEEEVEEDDFEEEGREHEYSSLVPLLNEFNQCYMIAVIQLLTRVPRFWKWLADEEESNLPLISPLSKKKILRTGTLLLGGLIRAEFHRSLENKHAPNPIKLNTFNEARKVSLPSFHVSQQEDAGEFLLQLLNHFTETNDNSKMFFEKYMSLHYQQTKKCCQCGDMKRAPIDFLSVLPVPMMSSNLDGMDHLSDFINKIFYNPITMDKSAWVRCELCNNEKTPTTENCVITHLPEYLFFNLIRYESKGKETSKLNHDVIADRVITLKGEETVEHHAYECTYYLQGVICHKGDGYKNGHYTTFLIEAINDKNYYHFLNDKKHEVVSEDEFETMSRKNGYIYLYTKNNPSSFGRDPYLHQSMKTIDVQSSFLKELLHSRAKRNPPRCAKQPRKSELQVVDPNQISMTSFVIKRNQSSTKETTKETTDQSKDDIQVIRRK